MRRLGSSFLCGSALVTGMALSSGCSRDALGSRALSIVGAGVTNDPSNRTLRFDVLKFGLDSFCLEMLKGGVPLKLGDDEPVLGRFFADSCQAQVVDDEAHKSFVVQYAGKGYAWTNLSQRIAFSSRGVIEYDTDFQLGDGAMYVYFRPKTIDGAGFQTTFVESTLAQSGLALSGTNPDELGRHIVESQLHRGFTVIRYNKDGETDFAEGLVPTGEHPFKPFNVQTSKHVLADERTEVHTGQQDYIGAFEVKDSGQAIYLSASLDGAANADILVIPKPLGDTMLAKYLLGPGGAPLPSPALLDETIQQSTGDALWQRYVNVEPGSYYVVVDNTAQAGHSAPSSTTQDDAAAKLDYLVLVGPRP
ncbi:MAG TPA: hypothetical protein VGI10_08220 [Polyangiaceae bacterium]|jgi:hypothetical protein